MISTDAAGNSYSLSFKYNKNVNGQNSTVVLQIGDGENQISLQLIERVLKYIQSGKDTNSSEFNQVLDTALYNGLSAKEKELLDDLKNNASAISGGGFSLTQDSLDYTPSYQNVPTDEYFNDLKAAEELDFKNRELAKFDKKMRKISGNQTLEEMVNDVNGTNMVLSNLHMTDFNRLNNLNINSPAF